MSTTEEGRDKWEVLRESNLDPAIIDHFIQQQEERRTDGGLKRGLADWRKVASNPQTVDLIRAAGDGGNLRFRVSHRTNRRGHPGRPHDAGLSLELGVVGPDEGQGPDMPVISVVRRDGQEPIQEPPGGGAWNLPCSLCGALVSIRDVTLLNLALQTAVARSSVITLT